VRLLRVLFVAFAAMISIAMAQTVPKTVHQDAFSIVGIQVRTTGEAEVTDEGVIPALWQRFYSEHILDKIPEKADQSVYAVYTDYSRDRMGGYTVVIGAKVTGQPQVPAGLVLKAIPAGDYAVVPSEIGPPSSVIPTAWQKVWALEDKDLLGGKRAYKADYELYSSSSTDPQKAQADLYVGLKNTAPKQKPPTKGGFRISDASS